MAMCSKCQGLYNEYASIKGQLSSAADQAAECSSKTTSTKSAFSSVIIGGVTIDKDDADNISKELESISENLSAMIGQCDSEMNRIRNACPGPNHYKRKNTRLNSENE